MKHHGPDVPPAHLRVWRQWARLGCALPSIAEMQSQIADPVPPDWEPVRQVVVAFRSFAESETLRLHQLLNQSDQSLVPLSDPLHFSLREHRWLDLQREREETYSDWLAWLLQEIRSAEKVLTLFGLEGTEFGAKVRDASLLVDREEPIRVRSGGRKRLDLVIRFGNVGILLVEVKVRSIEEAGGSENLEDYFAWLKSQEPAAKLAILLVPEAIESPYDGWDVSTWQEVALGLRAWAVALRNAAPNNLLLASLLLCFAGAVEQNVLGLEGGEDASAAPQTSRYLEKFLVENQP